MKLKICGIRRPEDVAYLNAAPPDYAGFILSERFWRYVGSGNLPLLTQALSPEIQRVGVFVNEKPEWIAQFLPYIDVIQLHGEETAEDILHLRKLTDKEIWKAVRVRTAEEIQTACELPVEKLLLDSYVENEYGGSGKTAKWDMITQAEITKPFFLAGGISTDNFLTAAETVHPYGVDVSSAVETDRCKDGKKISAMTALVRTFTERRKIYG
jgi:phosphoribosylanthranilate isomerase